MGDEHTDLKVDVAVLKEQMATLRKSIEARAGREWGIIATGIALVGTILAKNLGFM